MKRVFVTLTLAIVVSLSSAHAQQTAKFVFLFIGDGMGPVHVEAAQKASDRTLNMTSLPVHGSCTTHAANARVTDSAASGTALACGEKTNCHVIGKDPQGQPLENLSEVAQGKGLKVGIVTSVTINHATPAAFYAHVDRRHQYFEIAKQLAESDISYFGGGGMAEQRNKEGVDALALAKRNGFTVVRTLRDLTALKPGGKVYAFNHRLDGGSLPYALDYQDDDITLAEFVAEGIRLLDNDKGFFMMVEGGKIDWAAHANNLPNVVNDLLAFDKAVGVAVDFMKQRPDETLVLVTADHETGGLRKLDGAHDPKTTATQRAGYAFSRHGHTGVKVPVYAGGVSATLFAGEQDNTDISKKIKALLP